MKTRNVNIYSQKYMETKVRLISKTPESPEDLRALAVAIAEPIKHA